MKVKFLPQNVEHEIEFNETVLHLAQRNDIHIQSVCKGLPSCAECRIQIKSGENNVPHPSSKELSLIGTAYYVDQSRLACQLRCFGDVVVDLSQQIEKESRAIQRPSGPAGRKSAQDQPSHAVKGNIIEDYHDDDGKLLVTQLDPKERRPGHDDFYNEFSQESVQQKDNRPQHGKNHQKNKQHRDRRPNSNDRSKNR